jgi:YHS domain-containing protein
MTETLPFNRKARPAPACSWRSNESYSGDERSELLAVANPFVNPAGSPEDDGIVGEAISLPPQLSAAIRFGSEQELECEMNDKGQKRMASASNFVIVAITLFIAAVAAFTVLKGSVAHAATAPVFTGLVKGVAVGGYDPVAYFTDGKPVAGSKDITLEHEGATWRFASEANREAFKADPAKYAPQYGGYCAYAVSQGYTAKGDPNAWSVVDGKLYLNYDLNVKKTWEKDTAGYISKANANWPGVLGK